MRVQKLRFNATGSVPCGSRSRAYSIILHEQREKCFINTNLRASKPATIRDVRRAVVVAVDLFGA